MFKFLTKISGLFLFAALMTGISLAQSDEGLKISIDKKTEELKQIHQQLEETQKKLNDAGKKKQTLSRAISDSNYRISQLQLNLKSNKITIDKLGLEIRELDDDIDTTKEQIKFRSEAINKIFRELQIKEDESLLMAFLKNQSLAESLKEVQDLTLTKEALSTEIEALQNLKTNLDDQVTKVTKNKQGIEREYQTSTVRKKILEEEHVENKSLLALTKNKEKEYEQLIDELAERQAKIAEEIEQLEFELRKQIDTGALPPKRPGVLAWPIEQGWKKLTQEHGATAFAKYGYKGQWHNGIDIGSPIGAIITSASDGIVLATGNQDQYCNRGAYGKYIVVKHFNNLVTLYAHLSNIGVSVGDKVERGDIIGYVGHTGYSTGPHLHFTVYDAGTFKMRKSSTCGPMPSGGDINPRDYL